MVDMKEIKIGSHKIGNRNPVFIIAEVGINHNGDIELAKRMIKAAKEVNVDAVKFQTFQAETIMTETAGGAAHLEAGAGKEDVYSFSKRIQFSAEDHHELFEYSKDIGITFLSSPLSFSSVDLLDDVGVTAYKIASMDLNHIPFLEYVGRKGKPVILSTGMGTLGEIETALNTLNSAGAKDVILLHCTSQYPPKPEEVNLLAMNTIHQAFGVPIGYSDHTNGTAVPVAAAALGACVIEKHFTLDKTLPGPDQSFSGDPEEFKTLVSQIRIVEKALGSPIKQPTPGELEIKKSFCRSLVSEENIPAGTIISRDMLTFKRPGSGIAPSDIEWVIGRTTKVDIKRDTVIELKDLV